MHLESTIEKYFCKRIIELGGKTFKFTPQGQRGFHDRVAVLPGGRVMWVELKRPVGGVWSVIQQARHREMIELGCECYLFSTKGEIDAVFG